MNFNKLYEFIAKFFLPSFLSGGDFFFYSDLYLFLSLLYGTQVYSFAAIPAICWPCFMLIFCQIFVPWLQFVAFSALMRSAEILAIWSATSFEGYETAGVRCYCVYFLAICQLCLLLIAALIFSAGFYSAPNFFFVEQKMFRFTWFCRFLCILREILLSALGWFLSSLILLKVILKISCSAKQFKMNRVNIKNWSQK